MSIIDHCLLSRPFLSISKEARTFLRPGYLDFNIIRTIMSPSLSTLTRWASPRWGSETLTSETPDPIARSTQIAQTGPEAFRSLGRRGSEKELGVGHSPSFSWLSPIAFQIASEGYGAQPWRNGDSCTSLGPVSELQGLRARCMTWPHRPEGPGMKARDLMRDRVRSDRLLKLT